MREQQKQAPGYLAARTACRLPKIRKYRVRFIVYQWESTESASFLTCFFRRVTRTSQAVLQRPAEHFQGTLDR